MKNHQKNIFEEKEKKNMFRFGGGGYLCKIKIMLSSEFFRRFTYNGINIKVAERKFDFLYFFIFFLRENASQFFSLKKYFCYYKYNKKLKNKHNIVFLLQRINDK